MKRAGILNAALSGALARLGHTDELLICDSGMPLPPGVEVVDLAFLPGVPAFADVLDGILAELVVEGAIAAREVRTANAGCATLLGARLPGLTYVPHEELKRLSRAGRLVVRTGEAKPYANVLLRCGVAF
ncbi:D-ribose pyranase [Streptosporangium sp. NBC_01639]|uniref:D-ribose pyranase n=1 Tax=unclassified Streptosporangium TaxID=2632669 RepID=UPI002DD9FCA1|nr:D-ribose pyranase [Streptosporangium sp. NBC_01756]WSC83817.1 D-ribose pyranase [Streptosporangium sp. NBC_01756]WTD57568.1 D-ribose pyranase [Streptosporangium sp. NBC_01639]